MAKAAKILQGDFQVEIDKKGHDLWREVGKLSQAGDEGGYWQSKILDWVMQDDSFRVDMFRFIDVLPSLKTPSQVSSHIREYLLREDRELPQLLKLALRAAVGGFASSLAARLIRSKVSEMAGRFIAGEDAKQALGLLRKLREEGVAHTLDLVGEATLSDAEAEVYYERYAELIDSLADEVQNWQDHAVLDHDHLGEIPRANISIKLSALAPFLDPVDVKGSVHALKERVLPLMLKAREKGVYVYVDMEDFEHREITYALYEEVLGEEELADWKDVGIVVQAYLKKSGEDIERLIALAKKRGAPVGIRLVKGAYWDHEVVRSRLHGYPCPVFTNKAETDIQYEALTRRLFEQREYLHPAIASHNLRSLSHALVVAEKLGVPKHAYEIQMLYGMALPERRALVAEGHRVRVYTPIGAMLPGMAYLVRRLLENTSNSSFLRLSHHDHRDIDQLLEAPEVVETVRGEGSDETFTNCALTDFSDQGKVADYQKALQAWEKKFPLNVPVMIERHAESGESSKEISDPSGEKGIVAKVEMASLDQAGRALRIAKSAQVGWRRSPLEKRCVFLETLAKGLELDRMRLAALMSHEVGKPWREADADLAEAVDFCRYYARQARSELGPQKQGDLHGEDNRLFYEGCGVSVVIAPWNFPLAILCGMSVASLVAGNTLIMKPAEESSAIAHELYLHMIKAGAPKDVVQLITGKGEEVGVRLVEDPDTALIAFTGSRQVGLSILESAAVHRPGQNHVKKVICEMGGKNAIIVDDNADLDVAVRGVVKSAFGFAGQKCSAASRLIVLEGVADALLERLVEATRSLRMAPATSPRCQLGPVISEEAHARIQSVMVNLGNDAKTWYKGVTSLGGYYVAPWIVEVQGAGHLLLQQEFFAPILAVIRVKSFSQALRVANDSEYALTGAVFSRSPARLEAARQKFQVGNLYLNQGSTGALVDRQPFGGFALSGSGLKAGGPGYLRQFANPRVITENTTRQGFTPGLG